MNYWMLGNGILVGSCLISLVISAVVLLGMTALKFLNFASLSFKKKEDTSLETICWNKSRLFFGPGMWFCFASQLHQSRWPLPGLEGCRRLQSGRDAKRCCEKVGLKISGFPFLSRFGNAANRESLNSF